MSVKGRLMAGFEPLHQRSYEDKRMSLREALSLIRTGSSIDRDRGEVQEVKSIDRARLIDRDVE